MSEWLQNAFDIASREGAISVTGFTYQGRDDETASNDWMATHLASGRIIGGICASPDRLFGVASALADAVDWQSFQTKDGWEVAVPDLLWVPGDVWLLFPDEFDVPRSPWSYVSPDDVQSMH